MIFICNFRFRRPDKRRNNYLDLIMADNSKGLRVRIEI